MLIKHNQTNHPSKCQINKKSNHRNEHCCIVGQMIDAAAIFPLDAASHCGYEEENREKRNISHHFYSLFPEVSPSKCVAVPAVQLCIFKF